jgi:hypothetical protein
MDAGQLDGLTRAVATAPSRRALLGVALGGVLAALGRQTAAAKKKGNGKGKGKGSGKKGCPKGKKRCGTKCIPKEDCCTAADCNGCWLESCINGGCQCEPHEIRQGLVCGVFPTCTPAGLPCFDNGECCSYRCGDDGLGGKVCHPGTLYCLGDRDCLSGDCRGYTCPEVWHQLLDPLGCTYERA